jgi:hypothetical protein
MASTDAESAVITVPYRSFAAHVAYVVRRPSLQYFAAHVHFATARAGMKIRRLWSFSTPLSDADYRKFFVCTSAARLPQTNPSGPNPPLVYGVLRSVRLRGSRQSKEAPDFSPLRDLLLGAARKPKNPRARSLHPSGGSVPRLSIDASNPLFCLPGSVTDILITSNGSRLPNAVRAYSRHSSHQLKEKQF